MFHLHYDSDTNRLVDGLAAQLAEPDDGNPLAPTEILVPQRGLERYIVRQLAERHGIAANLDFVLPNAWFWRLLRRGDALLPERSVFDRDVLHWRILGLMDADTVGCFDAGTSLADDPLARMRAAAHLATLFERYQSHRRDLLEAWEQAAEPGEPQACLWRALVESAAEPPRSRLVANFLRRHQAPGSPRPDGLPARLFAFDCVNLAPDLLRVLGVASRYAELHFFLPSPSGAYWGDVSHRRGRATVEENPPEGYFEQADNPLLVAFGGVGREFVGQMYSYELVQPDTEPEARPAPRPDTLLGRIQSDVLAQRAPDLAARCALPDPADQSLTVHASHSPLRAAQGLHDWLLDLFERYPDMEPRDVAVMTPDISRYAPAMDAVFGALPHGDRRFIPWTVVDRPVAELHPLAGLFLRLLSLPASRLSLDQVLDVLAVPELAEAAGLDATELAGVRDLALAAGIRWGEDAAEREAYGLPAFAEYSWSFGGERAVLGYALGEDCDQRMIDGVAPFGALEGDAARRFAALLAVQRVLHDLRRDMKKMRDVRAWQRRLQAALDDLLGEARLDAAAEQAMTSVRAALSALSEHARAAAYGGKLDWRCVREFLGKQMQQPSRAHAFLSGGVTVCDMVPLRNVPFRVVCMLGLDEDAFPRSDPVDAGNRVHADRLAGRQRVGDRSRRDDDRYCFLQTLMSAGDRLYLGYVGTSQRDGSKLQPSLVLTELLDVVCRGYFLDSADKDRARQALVTHHPLHPFSRRLFDGSEPKLFSYRHEWLAAAAGGSDTSVPSPFADASWQPESRHGALTPAELLDFLKQPHRAWLRGGLGMTLGMIEDADAEREPIIESPLDRSARDAGLVAALLETPDADPAALEAHARASATLPPLSLGEALFQKSLQEVGPAVEQWRAFGAAAAIEPQAFEMTLPSGRLLAGTLPALGAAGHGAWVAGGSHRRWLTWWLDVLMLRAGLEPAPDARAFGYESYPVPLLPSRQEARERLDELAGLREEGLVEPTPFLPDCGWLYAKHLHQARSKPRPKSLQEMREAALDAARKQWNKGRERDDPWVALALRGRDPFAPEAAKRFAERAERVYLPLLAAIDGGQAA